MVVCAAVHRWVVLCLDANCVQDGSHWWKQIAPEICDASEVFRALVCQVPLTVGRRIPAAEGAGLPPGKHIEIDTVVAVVALSIRTQ